MEEHILLNGDKSFTVSLKEVNSLHILPKVSNLHYDDDDYDLYNGVSPYRVPPKNLCHVKLDNIAQADCLVFFRK